MRFLVIVAIVAVFASVDADYPKEKNEEHNKVIAECLEKFKLSHEEYTKLRHDEIPEPDENMKCMVHCFFDTIGILKDGKFQADVAMKTFNVKSGDEVAKKYIDVCGKESGTTNCGIGYNTHKCLVKIGAY